VEGPSLELEVISVAIKINKINIETTEQPKMASIGDYWDEQTLESIMEFLREYNNIFPTTFIEMKGISRESGEMNIPLTPDARPIK
jgi:archaellum component FlaC